MITQKNHTITDNKKAEEMYSSAFVVPEDYAEIPE